MRSSPIIVLPMLLLFPFLLLPAAHAYCSIASTPRISLTPATTDIVNGTQLNGSFSLLSNSSGVTLGAAFVTEPIANFSFNASSGAFTFIPYTSLNETRILFYAVSPDGCAASLVATYAILHPPAIEASPAGSVTLKEGGATLFSANASGDARIVSLRWLLDNATVATGNWSYRYAPSFNDVGSHALVFTATSSRNLTSALLWNITVLYVNRSPYLFARLPDAYLPLAGKVSFNLSFYFVDPNRRRLTYNASVTPPSPAAGVPTANLSVEIDGEMVTVTANSPGVAFVAFTATNPSGASVTSDPSRYIVTDTLAATRNSYCGDKICLGNETCVTCAQDCGPCGQQACTPHWDCLPWGACRPLGYQYRNCTVTNGCENVTEKPPEAQRCQYNATCFDHLKNGNETGVDCGGNCAPCPTCSDGIQNQGESGVDCGGPCGPCPTCSDGIQNQGESDVDCGGTHCQPCIAGEHCLHMADCASLVCRDGVCTNATCDDHVQNDGESGVDCGGPCGSCPTCSDGIQNQGESGVDCGGPCGPCPTCSDGIQNQGEKLVDCGGPCRTCKARDYTAAAWPIARWLILGFLILVVLYLVNAIFASRMIFLFRHGKAIYFFYEDPPTYALIKAWNLLTRPFRFSHRKELSGLVVQTIGELRELRRLPSPAIKPALAAKLRGLYAAMLNLSPGFEFDQLLTTVRHSHFPFTLQVIILKNTKLLALLELAKLYDDPEYVLDEALRGLEELRKAF